MAEFVEFSVERQFFATIVQKWDPKFAKILRSTEPDYLQAEPYKWFLPKLRKYVEEYNTPIPWEYADVMMQREFQDPESLKEIRQAIWLLYSTEVQWGDEAVSNFRQYVSWRTYSAGFTASRDGYKKSQDMMLALDHGQRAIAKARSLLIDADVHDLGAEFPDREAEWVSERDNPGFRNRLELGIPELDAQLKLVEGTVNAFLAVFKRYKSIVLNHCGIAALVSGFNVLHVTYENTVEMTLDRYYSRLASIPLDDLVVMRVDPTSYGQAREFIEALHTRLSNRLKIISAESGRTTVADIEAQLDVLRTEEGFEPDVSIWDYLNEIGVSQADKSREERLNQTRAALDLRAHARDTRHGGARKKIVVTASQAKGEAIDKDTIDAGDFGKSIGIPQALDSLIGINQTKQERTNKTLRFNVVASRNSKILDIVETKCDISWMCIDINTWEWVADKAAILLSKIT